MSIRDPCRGLVVHTVRLVGFATADDVVHRTGLDRSLVCTHLAAAADSGLVVERRRPHLGWTISEPGRRWAAEWMAADVAALEATDIVRTTYRRFAVVNGEFLEACRRWQMIDVDGEPVPNPHTDPEYDRQAAAAVLGLVADMSLTLSDLSARVTRFERYRRRFDNAADQVTAGRHDFVTRPVVDSCHTIWFELHEDLLASMGRSRQDPP